VKSERQTPGHPPLIGMGLDRRGSAPASKNPAPRPAFVCQFEDAKRITEPRSSYRRAPDSQSIPKRR